MRNLLIVIIWAVAAIGLVIIATTTQPIQPIVDIQPIVEKAGSDVYSIRYYVLEVRGCEYLVSNATYGSALSVVHLGNCRNPVHASK